MANNIHLYKDLQDSELWQKMLEGDQAALNEIYFRHIKVLYSYGGKITSDQGLVEDAIQEIFITIWTKRKKLNTKVQVRFYLFKSLKRHILRALKKNKLDAYDFSDISENLKAEDPKNSAEDLPLKEIKATIKQLTERQKEVVFLRFYAQLGFEEIAAIMGLSKKATYKLLYRAIDRLQERFPKKIQRK